MLNALVMTSWLCLPIAPLNPVDEDTLASVNLHVTVGLSNPNGVVSVGPLVSIKYELLAIHPLMIRGTADFTYGQITSPLFPTGHLYTTMFGIDAIYYRGTNHLTGYIGFGVVYALHNFRAFNDTADSLFATEKVTTVDVEQQPGYRLTLGIRYHRTYSFEIGVVELHPDMKKTGRDRNGGETRSYEPTRTGSFRFSFGYLFEM